jgi:hypothetical protein
VDFTQDAHTFQHTRDEVRITARWESKMVKRSIEDVGDARNAEAIKLLKTDPEKFFEQTRQRQPFGFARDDDNGDRD